MSLAQAASLDWAPVSAAIQAHCLPEDEQLVKTCLSAALSSWLADDRVELAIDGIEELRTWPRMKGYLDIRGRFTGEPSPSRGPETAKKLRALAGKRVICDWKTAWGPLDDKWKKRYTRDWQWRLYGLLADADYFWFRGISAVPFAEAETLNHILEINDEVKRDAEKFLKQNFALRDTLIDIGESPWPKFWPCKSQSFTCPYLDDCSNLVEIPGNLSKDKIMSYSRWREFAACPEMHRRRGIADDEAEGERVTQFGIAVHAGLAEVYKQVFQGVQTQ